MGPLLATRIKRTAALALLAGWGLGGSDCLQARDPMKPGKFNTVQIRVVEGFPEIAPVPRQFPFAASLGLGEFDLDRIHVRQLSLPESSVRVRAKPVAPAPAPVPEEKSWLRRITPW